MVFICINCLSILMKYSSACNIQLQSIQVKIVSKEACSGKIPPPLPIKKIKQRKKKQADMVYVKTFLGLIKKQKQKQQNNKNKETKKQTSPPQTKEKKT